jgi:small-conductance mechanosensitive channel
MQQIKFIKNLISQNTTRWEWMNIASGWLLAKTSTLITLNTTYNPTVKHINASIVEYVSPLIIIGGITIFLLNRSKKRKAKEIEKLEYIIDGLFCNLIGISIYIILVMLISSLFLNVKQTNLMIQGLLSYEWSLCLVFGLILGNILQFHNEFKDSH